jgi:hypothetical protein
MTSRRQAQQRADQIAAFRDEVAALGAEGVTLDAAQLDSVRRHHDALLARLAGEHDVDASAAAKQMSLGMRIASLLGAAALTAAVVSFFDRLWDTLPLWGQVSVLTAAPPLATLVTAAAGRIEKTRYVASIFAIVACAAFVLQTIELGELLNLRRSPHVGALWAVFALVISVPWRLTVPFAFGAAVLVAYVPAVGLWFAGYEYGEVIGHPELVLASAAAWTLAVRRVPAELRPVARGVVLASALLAVLALSSVRDLTLLPIDGGRVRVFYQAIGFVVAVLVMYVGLRRGQREVVGIGTAFAALFLLTRFVDWWWDWMPKSLFFLIVAAAALAWLWALRIVRRRLTGPAA